MSNLRSVKKQRNSKDKLLIIKYVGYCMSQMPPEGANVGIDDLVTFAKYQLCREKHVLMKAPIWDEYTDEEILAEYYAMTYDKSEETRKEFEASLTAVDDVKMQWMEAEMAKNREIIDKIKKEGGIKKAEDAKTPEPEDEEVPLEGFDFDPSGV